MRVVVVSAAVILAVLPAYAALVTALTPFERLGDGAIVPVHWHWENFLLVWQRIPLAKYLLAGTLYSTVAAGVATAIAVVAGYALARFRFAGKRAFVYFLLLTQVIPLIVLAVPLFRIALTTGLFNTRLAVMVALAGVALAFPTFLMRTYLLSIPVEIEEAAMIDGCGRFQTLVRIVVPSALPAIWTAFALSFFITWQQFIIPLVLTESRELVPVTVGVFRLTGDHVTPWELVMAASLIGCIPPVVVYLVAQRHLTKGLTAGAVK